MRWRRALCALGPAARCAFRRPLSLVVRRPNEGMKEELAKYILELNDAARSTSRAEDRPLYEKYLASAAVILALVESGAAEESVRDEVKAHERLWGTTWLVDVAYMGPSAAWERFKKAMRVSGVF